MNKKTNKKINQKGITLVALVVTIVVLLILAGITITVLFGDNGIIKQAQKAKTETERDQADTQNGLNSLANDINKYTGSGSGENGDPVEDKEYDITKTEDLSVITTTNHETIKVKDSTGYNIITLPKGFRIITSEGTSVQSGIVISDKDEGTQGNEFVWIPVGEVTLDDGTTKKEIKLGRYNFDTSTGAPVEEGSQLAANYQAETGLRPNNWTDSYKDQAGNPAVVKELVTREDTTKNEGVALNNLNGLNAIAKNLGEFVKSVNDNGGYYLARYEASKNGEKPESKKDKAGWTSVKQITAALASRTMYTQADNVGVESDLVNSYAWDTAIVYISQMKDEYANFANMTYKNVGKASPVNTGTNDSDKFCNIYDMVANRYEWTTEYSTYAVSSDARPCVIRGGLYNYSDFYVAGRYHSSATVSGSDVGFRPLLYIK